MVLHYNPRPQIVALTRESGSVIAPLELLLEKFLDGWRPSEPGWLKRLRQLLVILYLLNDRSWVNVLLCLDTVSDDILVSRVLELLQLHDLLPERNLALSLQNAPNATVDTKHFFNRLFLPVLDVTNKLLIHILADLAVSVALGHEASDNIVCVARHLLVSGLLVLRGVRFRAKGKVRVRVELCGRNVRHGEVLT